MQLKLECYILQRLLNVLKSLNYIKVKKIILDPVMVAKDGTKVNQYESNKFIKIKID